VSAASDSDGGGADRADGPALLSRVLKLTGMVVAPTTLVTAMLYFFGYTREKVYFGYFGIDLGTVGLTTTDYLVRSAGVAFAPLGVLSVVALVVVTFYPAATAFLVGSRRPVAMVVVCGLGAVATGLFAVSVVALMSGRKRVGPPLLAPVALGAAAFASGFTLVLVQRHQRMPASLREGLAASSAGRLAAFVVVVLVATFWGTANVGQARGRSAARVFEASLREQPRVILYSQRRLQIRGPGVNTQRLDPADAAYIYRYANLRLLLHSAGRWFLLPAGWRHDKYSTMIILPDSDPAIRVELGP
jgi:hypothetical protein